MDVITIDINCAHHVIFEAFVAWFVSPIEIPNDEGTIG